jgi:hypothetical protein
MQKKILISVVVFLALVVASLITVPYLFKDTIVTFIKKEVNKDLLATVNFNEVDITLFKSFPDATLKLKEVTVINQAPFANDTLFYAHQIDLDFNIKQLFKKEISSLAIKDIAVNNALIQLKVKADGAYNWDITKPSVDESSTSASTFQMNIKQYIVNNSTVIYDDEVSNMYLEINGLNHKGTGDFTASKVDIQTNSTADEVTFSMNKIPYINKAKVVLDALLGVDFDVMRFTFKDNKGLLNDLALVFEGAVQMNENDMDIDLKFNAPQADFKSLLSLVPSAYSENFKGVNATGKANISGNFIGKYTDTSLPTFEILIQTEKSQFQYPSLPKAVKNIYFDGIIKNETGNIEATYLSINDMRLTIDNDYFLAKGLVTNFVHNPTVDGYFKGTINLANLSKAYPLPASIPIKGILKADVTIKADQQSITNNQFKNIKNAGVISLEQFLYEGDVMPKPFQIDKASLRFDNHTVQLTEFIAKTGESDLNVTGRLDNFYAFLFDNKELKGVFSAQANQFIIADFLKAETAAKTKDDTKSASSFKIPANLDLTANVAAKNVQYDNIKLKEVSGQLLLKDEKVIFNNTKANLLGGSIAINGSVNTKTTPATFDMDLGIQNFDIGESFKMLETFQSIAPIAQALKGKFNTSFVLKGNLTDDMTPDINSLSGNALAQMLVDQIDTKESKVLSLLGSQFSFLDVNKLNLKDLKTAVTFADGKVTLKPITLKWNDISMQINGVHGFDKTVNYNLQMDLPAKYLGKEASHFLSKMTAEEQDKLSVPLTTTISGTFDALQIKPNMQAAVNTLTQKMVSTQKDKFVGKGTDALSTLISGKKPTETKNDSVTTTPKEAIKTTVNDAVKTKTNEVINKASQDLLKGVFGKKTVKKDTIKKN